MELNQFAVYQLKKTPETRPLQFCPYRALLEKGLSVQYKNYEQVYISRMQKDDTPEVIQSRINRKMPNNFKGHSIGTSDVIVLNRNGEVTAYYADKDSFVSIAGFLRHDSSGTVISIETEDFQIAGKEGRWLAIDSLLIDGHEFFLMEHSKYGSDAAYVVLAADGTVVVEDNYNGFDEAAKQQIREWMHPVKAIQNQPQGTDGKVPLENWQKYMENGEYLRSAEISEEQNYNMIDGRNNNTAPKKDRARVSVLARLHQKQAEIAKRSGKPAQQMSMTEDMERKRK
jgi:hypothetical protein